MQSLIMVAAAHHKRHSLLACALAKMFSIFFQFDIKTAKKKAPKK
jgi:hypothetical protein